MIAVDSSVLVAAFSSWHEQHEPADQALANHPRAASHSVLEAYSVLTRLPTPHRASPSIVRDFLADRLTEPSVVQKAAAQRALVPSLAERGISGGAV